MDGNQGVAVFLPLPGCFGWLLAAIPAISLYDDLVPIYGSM